MDIYDEGIKLVRGALSTDEAVGEKAEEERLQDGEDSLQLHRELVVTRKLFGSREN